MKKLILIFALFLGVTSICIATEGESNSCSSSSSSGRPSEPTHWAICVTNPDNISAGEQESFYFAYDDGVIWVYGTRDTTFSSPIRTAPSGHPSFQYKFMRAGVVWYLPV